MRWPATAAAISGSGRRTVWRATTGSVSGCGARKTACRPMRFPPSMWMPTTGSGSRPPLASCCWTASTGASGLYRIGPDGRRQRFMPDPGDPRSLPSASVALLATDHAGTLWAGTRGGLARWTGDGFETVPGLEDEPLLLWLAPDRDGRL